MNVSRKGFLFQAGLGSISLLAGLPLLSHLASSSPERIKPHGLSRGDTIGLISPASSLSRDSEYDEVAKTIKSLGFSVKIGAHAREHYGYLAGSDAHRADDLNLMFDDPDVDAIIPFRGGWGCDRILGLLNYDLIRQHPKPLIGYSDITSLLLAIYAKTGLMTYHGPVGSSEWKGFTLSYFKKALMQSQPYTLHNSTSPTDFDQFLRMISPGEASGTLLGGNLTVLTSMMGSDYLPSWKGAILFVEDIGEDIYRIDRMLTQLKLNGVFDQLNGFIFGKCTDCNVDSGFHFSLEQIIKDHIKDYEIPAFIGANIGHIAQIFTLPLGIKASINARSGTIKLLESPVKLNT